jgi:hypothetical protein
MANSWTNSAQRRFVNLYTGDGSSTVTNPSGFTFASPPQYWFYILATCDMDGSSAVNSTYFTSSVDTSIQALNKGR